MINEIHNYISSLNHSSYFAGLIMLIMNLGSKYITIELSKTQEQFIKNKIGRQILLFSIMWMGTRDIYKSLILTAVFVILTDYIFNEKSKFCILPKHMQAVENAIDVNNDGEVGDEEFNNALQILQKAKKKKANKNKMDAYSNFMNYTD